MNEEKLQLCNDLSHRKQKKTLTMYTQKLHPFTRNAKRGWCTDCIVFYSDEISRTLSRIGKPDRNKFAKMDANIGRRQRTKVPTKQTVLRRKSERKNSISTVTFHEIIFHCCTWKRNYLFCWLCLTDFPTPNKNQLVLTHDDL